MNKNYYYLKKNEPITDNNISSSIKFLHIDEHYFLPIEYIPPNVKSLYFHGDCKIALSELPANITDIVFYKNTKLYNKISNFVTFLHIDKCDSLSYDLLPDNLEELWGSGENFNQSLEGLPSTLKILSLGRNFKQSINNLPRNLVKLHLSCYSIFNSEVKNLPETLTHINFGKKFNSNVEFSNSVEYITFGEEFNKEINKYPKSLIYIKFGWNFNFPLDNLPSSLKKLILGHCYNHSLDFLPSSLLYLEIDTNFNKTINNLPPSLRQLHFTKFSCFDKPIESLPKSLEYLRFGDRFNNEIKTYPPNLKYISFGDNFNKTIDNITSQHIYFSNYKCPINIVNTRVEYLCFCGVFNEKIINLPPNIHLYFAEPTINILNNLPPIKKCTIVPNNLKEEINNLPSTINELILINLDAYNKNDEANIKVQNVKKYITKIPFGCIVSTIKLEDYNKKYINYVHEQLRPTYFS